MYQNLRNSLGKDTVLASERMYDVVQVGYGPVGQVCAGLLGRKGYDVAVFERHSGLYALPRAGHFDHEIMRVIQSLGAGSAVQEDLFRCSRYEWRNQHGETLVDIDWSRDGVSGWASDYLFYQPHVENALDAAVRQCPNVSVEHGWEARAAREFADHVEVDLRAYHLNEDGSASYGAERTVKARYVIGTDGANSIVRAESGGEMEFLGFDEQWLVTDFRQKRPLNFEFDNGQLCDPARPLCLFQLGQTHRRFEFMVMPDDDIDELQKPESVWSLVSDWLSPDDAELIRSTVYTFRSGTAAPWRKGRVFLAGDSAHLMPPFLGQGMCSGIRDATNLAWKLDLVLRGAARDKILDTYECERKPHVREIIDQAVALGKVSCTIDPEAAAERDRMLLGGEVPQPPFPWLREGILQRNPSTKSALLVGRLGVQGKVEINGEVGLADDLIGHGWHLISQRDIAAGLGDAERQIFDDLGIRTLVVGDHGLTDVEGTYRDYFEAHGVSAVLVRPDYYIFGALEDGQPLAALICDLGHQLGHAEIADREVATR